MASAVTFVSGFSFFFFICSFFAKVAYGVGLSAKSLAHQSKAKKPGHFFLSWHEKPQQYPGSVFLQELFPSSALSFSSQLCRKWADLSIRKENQSHGQVKTQKNIFAAVSEVNFLWCNSLEQDKKSVVQGCRMDMMGGTAAGMLEGGEDGCSCASLQHSECCTAEHQRHQCSLPSFPGKPTAAGLALHDSRASGVQQLGASQAG